MRRALRRLAVGWLPPAWRPSGAGLTRGPSLPAGLGTRSRLTPHRGGASCHARWPPAAGRAGASRLGAFRGHGPSGAMAHRKPARSRARATPTGWTLLPRARRRRYRFPSRPCACPRRSGSAGGRCASRRRKGRRTWAGSRQAQAPATRARRAWGWPAWGRAPCRRRSPLEDSAGRRPKYGMRCLGGSKRGSSPRAAPVVTAPGPGTPRRPWWGRAHGRHAPGLALRVPCVLQTLQAGGRVGARAAVYLADELLRRCGPASCREPAARVPRGPGRESAGQAAARRLGGALGPPGGHRAPLHGRGRGHGAPPLLREGPRREGAPPSASTGPMASPRGGWL
jgi:hypothetical protein